MSGGLLPSPAKRGRGRPKGSGGKRSAELAGYIAARFGGSAAQQMAAVCMVTPAEVRQAGGVLKARVLKARDLALALNIDVADAWKLLAQELAQLAPYTDKRQPQAMEIAATGWTPSVVIQVEGAVHLAGEVTDADFVEVFQSGPELVAPSKSHDEGQAVDRPDLFEHGPDD